MFQTIINEILQNLVNTREVASFIDDIIVEIEKEEKYYKVVEKAVKKLMKNDLYVKLERTYIVSEKGEIRFLQVVIGLKEIKMEKRNIKAVLDWPTSNRVKNV